MLLFLSDFCELFVNEYMLLINPATQPFGGFLSRYVPVGIPVAIGMVAAYLESHGIHCNVHDEEIERVTPDLSLIHI